jgi:hypothetical protein
MDMCPSKNLIADQAVIASRLTPTVNPDASVRNLSAIKPPSRASFALTRGMARLQKRICRPAQNRSPLTALFWKLPRRLLTSTIIPAATDFETIEGRKLKGIVIKYR